MLGGSRPLQANVVGVGFRRWNPAMPPSHNPQSAPPPGAHGSNVKTAAAPRRPAHSGAKRVGRGRGRFASRGSGGRRICDRPPRFGGWNRTEGVAGARLKRPTVSRRVASGPGLGAGSGRPPNMEPPCSQQLCDAGPEDAGRVASAGVRRRPHPDNTLRTTMPCGDDRPPRSESRSGPRQSGTARHAVATTTHSPRPGVRTRRRSPKSRTTAAHRSPATKCPA